MCLTKIVDHNRKYRSQWPYFYKLNQGPLGTLHTKYEYFLACGFIEKDYFKNWATLHKMTHNSMTNMGSTPILTNLVRIHPRNIHTKFKANPCSGLKEQNKKVKVHDDKDVNDDDGHWVIAIVTRTH